MTSKNSYLKLSKSNFKRRIPFLVLGFIFSFIMITIITFFKYKSYTYQYDMYDIKYLKIQITDILANNDYIHTLVTAVLAILFAITGNNWNNSQKKNDFYKSLPVKENTRFWYIHINSFISFLICFGVNLIFANLIIASFKIYESYYITASLYSLFIH